MNRITRNETLRDWRVLLLILVDLLALLALFPRVTRSTTDFSVTDVDSTLIVQMVLEDHFQDVEHLLSFMEGGLQVHGFSFELPGPREHETVESELELYLAGMIPRGISPSVRISNITQAEANITITSDDAVITTFIENELVVKVTSLQRLGDTISMTLDKRIDRQDLLDLLKESASITAFDNPRTLKTNLKLGIDFLGGFYYNVRPIGITFGVEVSSANVTPTLLGEYLDTTVDLVEDGERGLLTLQIQNPEFGGNASAELFEFVIDTFFETNPPFRKITFTFGEPTSELVVNATNFNALQVVLNRSLTLEYDVVGGNELAGVFEVEGKGSEATLEELEANLSSYLEILDYQTKVSDETIQQVQDMIQSRGNFLGVSDLRLKRIGDEFVQVESPERISGNSSILEPLDFEARIWKNENETVLAFTSEDVARVDHFYFVSDAGGWSVPLTLKTDSAEEFREVAEALGAISENEEERNAHKLGMFFNKFEVFNASFSESLARSMREGTVVSILAITGGPRENTEARQRAEDLFINLEASFPTALKTAGEGQIPPILGKDFGRQVAAAAAAALLGVSIVVYLRYRRPKLVLAILLVSLSEVLIILGFAVLIGWYLDLASVAAIIAVIGTGVDHQIVITDEAVYQGEGKKRLVISTRISRAFFIIFTAAATTVIAMTPLAYVGLGRLRGFAIVTIVGVLSGVIITRPAFGRIVRRIVGGR